MKSSAGLSFAILDLNGNVWKDDVELIKEK